MSTLLAAVKVSDSIQPPEIVTIAFGLGGREAAGRMLGDAYDKGAEQRGQVDQGMRVGKGRASDDAQRTSDEAGRGRRDGTGPAATVAVPG